MLELFRGPGEECVVTMRFPWFPRWRRPPRSNLLVLLGTAVLLLLRVRSVPNLSVPNLGDDPIHSEAFRTKLHVPNKSVRYTPHRSTTIDIISIGTMHQSTLQDAQRRTFASAPSVRTFYQITEADDYDATCHTSLTTAAMNRISDTCRRVPIYAWWNQMRRVRANHYLTKGYLALKANPRGWLCAQQRPIAAFWKAMQDYAQGTPIPDYLVMIDDDTFLNMPLVLEELRSSYPSTTPYVVCGCRFRFHDQRFTFPYGGYGTFITGAVISKLLQPIDCYSRREFDRQVCSVIRRSHVGEAEVFVNGMCLAELIYRFATQHKYTDANDWQFWTIDRPMYCMHSDW